MREDDLFVIGWVVVALVIAWGLIWVSDQTEPWNRDDDE